MVTARTGQPGGVTRTLAPYSVAARTYTASHAATSPGGEAAHDDGGAGRDRRDRDALLRVLAGDGPRSAGRGGRSDHGGGRKLERPLGSDRNEGRPRRRDRPGRRLDVERRDREEEAG